MTRSSFRRNALSALALLLAVGCGQDTTSSPPPPSGTCLLQACAVFFTEVLADPKADDQLHEYVELFNPGAEDVDLSGCTLEIMPGEGSSRRHVITGAEPVLVPAGGFLLLGPPEALEVGYKWGDRIGELPNSSTKGTHFLRLRAGDLLIDEFAYMDLTGETALGKPVSGASFQLDQLAWTCEANDDPASWCLGARESGSRHGSPGAANDACVAAGQCVDAASGERRAVSAPGACDLVLSEVLNNPDGADDDKEWIELYVRGAGPFDLNGLLLQKGDGDPVPLLAADPAACITGRQGDRLVLVQSFDREKNGGIGNGDAKFDAVLGNSDLRLRLLSADGQVAIDDVTLAAAAGQGSSWARHDETPPDCPAADPTAAWFECSFPSPGEVNDCELPPPVSECRDEDGELRAIVSPASCEVILTEVLNNPDGPDEGKEWIELYVTGAGPYDLNGLLLQSGTGAPRALTHATDECVSAVAGERFLLAGSLDPALNGGLDPVDAAFSGTLLNNGPTLSLLLSDGETVVDTVTLGDDPGSGVPWVLREEFFDCAANDEVANWCAGVPSPLAANACADETPDSCVDLVSALERDVVAPGECDIVFSEVLNNPEGTDGDKEWIELVVVGAGPFDLNGLKLRKGTGTPEALVPLRETCLTGRAGDRFLLVKDALNQDGDASFAMTLANSDLALALLLRDGSTLVDAITLGADPGQGISWNLREDRADCAANDLPENWCGLAPTPKDTNLDCPVVVQPGFCLPTAGGEPRALVPPPADAVILSEFFANPAGEEAPQEWLELYVSGLGAYDLNGLLLKLGDHAAMTLDSAACVDVAHGEWILLAKSGDPLLNGGLPTPDLLFSGSLVNANLRVELLHPDGVTLLDAVSYAPSSGEGHSVQLDIDLLSAIDNDLESSWCRSLGLGTPRMPNADCEP